MPPVIGPMKVAAGPIRGSAPGPGRGSRLSAAAAGGRQHRYDEAMDQGGSPAGHEAERIEARRRARVNSAGKAKQGQCPHDDPFVAGGSLRGKPLAETGLAIATVPATTLVVALRRRRRRKASNQAWRYRTHHEASADSPRMVSSNYQDELSARAESARGGRAIRFSSAREPFCSPRRGER